MILGHVKESHRLPYLSTTVATDVQARLFGIRDISQDELVPDISTIGATKDWSLRQVNTGQKLTAEEVMKDNPELQALFAKKKKSLVEKRKNDTPENERVY